MEYLVYILLIVGLLFTIINIKKFQNNLLDSQKSENEKFKKIIEEIRRDNQKLEQRIKDLENKPQYRKLKIDETKLKKFKKEIKTASDYVDELIKELENEGIYCITHEQVHLTDLISNKKFGNKPIRMIKKLYFSFDDKKVMYNLLFLNKNQFTSKYKCNLNYDDVVVYFRNHFKDAEIIKEMFKEEIRKRLTGEIADVLTGDEDKNKNSNDELKKILWRKINRVSTHQSASSNSKIPNDWWSY